MELVEEIRVNGWEFKLQDYGPEDRFYQCRGAIMYDQDHDETPEPELWRAAHKLAGILTKDGLDVEVEHSEKGWVEVVIINE